MIPARRPDQSHDDHQREVAAWVGCTVDELNVQHDPLHLLISAYLRIPSHSLMAARGEAHDETLAWIEEAAVLHVQRWMAHAGVVLL